MSEKSALQYYNNNAKSEFSGLKLDSSEINVLFNSSSNMALFAGVTQLKFASNDKETGVQVGIIGTSKLGETTTAYGVLAAGTNVASIELGIGQELAQNVELNLFYRYAEYRDLSFGGSSDAFWLSGIGAGVTVKL